MQGHYSISNSGEDMANVFTFVSDNTDVEWTFQGNKKGNFIIGTLHEKAQAFSVYGIDGFNRSSVDFHIHSHPGSSREDFTISGPDYGNAKTTWKVDPEAKYYVYAPKLTKESWNKVYPNRRINHEPGKLFPINRE